MCGRYYIASEEDAAEMDRIIEEIERRLAGAPETFALKTGEIFPTDVVPVIAGNKRREIMPFPMKWGYSRPDGKGVVINARSESVFDKPIFRQGILSRRCLVPATNYFEWRKTGGRQKYAIRPRGEKLLCMAGIYRYEADLKLPRFVILTRPAAEGLRFIHDRMPVVLPAEAHEQWLSGEGDVLRLLSEASENMEYEAV
jgi:putative SOS response-associated peptidase YedK